MLLLTATPHKGDPANFSLFLQLLDVDAYADVKSIREAMDAPQRTVLPAADKGGDGLFSGAAGRTTPGSPRRSSPSAFRTRSISR